MPWTPASDTRAEWGTLRVIINNVDVTMFRGGGTMVTDYQFTDPYGHGPCTIRFDQITPFEANDLGDGDLDWYTLGGTVHLHQVLDSELMSRMWVGLIMRRSFTGNALTLECGGEFSGRLSLALHQPKFKREVLDCGRMVFEEAHLTSSKFDLTPDLGPETGIEIEMRGDRAMTRLGFIDEILANAQTLTEQWTILPHPDDPLNYVMQVRDETTVDVTVDFGGHGVEIDLADDLAERPNIYYAEGVAPDLSRWRNAVYPNLGPSAKPPYPLAGGTPFGIGTTNADTLDGHGIGIMERELHGNGQLTLEDGVDDTFDANTVDAIEEVQDKAGLPVTGIVDPDTWAAIFNDGFPAQSLSQAFFDPLVQDSRTRYLNRSSGGTAIGVNADWDPDVVHVETFVSMGEGVSKQRARRALRAQYRKTNSPSWVGSVTLTADPHEMSRFDIRAGMNLKLNNFASDLVVHIAAVSVDWPSASVSLTVDSQARDFITLAQIVERNRNARRDPAKQWAHQLRRSAQTSDAIIGWDKESGAGIIPATECEAGTWTVIPIVAGESGTMSNLSMNTDPPTEFAVGIFSEMVGAPHLTDVAPTPLAPRDDDTTWAGGGGGGGGDPEFHDWHPDLTDWKRFGRQRLLVYAAGTGDNADVSGLPCGYWPAMGKNADPELTGDWFDPVSFSYFTFAKPFLYLAVWVTDTTTVTGRMWAQLDEGV